MIKRQEHFLAQPVEEIFWRRANSTLCSQIALRGSDDDYQHLILSFHVQNPTDVSCCSASTVSYTNEMNVIHKEQASSIII